MDVHCFGNGKKMGKFCLENRTKSLQSGPLVVQFLIFQAKYIGMHINPNLKSFGGYSLI